MCVSIHMIGLFLACTYVCVCVCVLYIGGLWGASVLMCVKCRVVRVRVRVCVVFS